MTRIVDSTFNGAHDKAVHFDGCAELIVTGSHFQNIAKAIDSFGKTEKSEASCSRNITIEDSSFVRVNTVVAIDANSRDTATMSKNHFLSVHQMCEDEGGVIVRHQELTDVVHCGSAVALPSHIVTGVTDVIRPST